MKVGAIMKKSVSAVLVAIAAGVHGAESQPSPPANVPSIQDRPPVRTFSPVELLKRRQLNFTGGFKWEQSPRFDPLVVLDYMEVDGSWWAVERHEGLYHTITNRDRLDQIAETARRQASSNYRVVPYTGMWSWKEGTTLTSKPFLGEHLNVLATNIAGTWFVLDNRPTGGNVMGAMTPATNDFQLLLIIDETYKSAVRQRNGELPLAPPPGVKDPAKKERDPLGV